MTSPYYDMFIFQFLYHYFYNYVELIRLFIFSGSES